MRREPADLVLLSLVTFGLVADVPLLRKGHATVSTRAGCTNGRKVAVAYLAAHFLGLLPRRFDVLCRAGDLVRVRFCPA